MVEPDDFGLGPVETIARTADSRRAPSHGAFWAAWQNRVLAEATTLALRREADPSDPTATHEFESVRHARIGCTLAEPHDPARIRAGLVVGHGYGSPDPLAQSRVRWQAYASRGIATLAIRLRGYPGSQLDTGPLASDWGRIAHGLEGLLAHPPAPEVWILSDWTADLALACRALRRHLARRTGSPGLPLFLRGDSLSGGLAVLAAARFSAIQQTFPMIDRLVLANPSLGDWAWRLRTIPPDRALGAGGDVARFLRDTGADPAAASAQLRLFDPVVHARRVFCPVLCRLAQRDEVVPAPTAAAVFNALATSPGLRWRFLTRYGHHEGGLAHARRSALFERCCEDILDPDRTPGEVMASWEGVACDPAATAV